MGSRKDIPPTPVGDTCDPPSNSKMGRYAVVFTSWIVATGAIRIEGHIPETNHFPNPSRTYRMILRIRRTMQHPCEIRPGSLRLRVCIGSFNFGRLAWCHNSSRSWSADYQAGGRTIGLREDGFGTIRSNLRFVPVSTVDLWLFRFKMNFLQSVCVKYHNS